MKQMMTKTEDVKIETIDSNLNIKGTEKIEIIYPENIDLPNYDYGLSQNTLDYNIALRNKPIEQQTKILLVQNSTLGSISYTGLGFKPTTIEADFYCQNGSESCFGHGYYSGGIYKTYVVHGGGSVSPGSYIASGQNASGYIHASVTSLDKDGFTINYTGSIPPTIDIIFKCSK